MALGANRWVYAVTDKRPSLTFTKHDQVTKDVVSKPLPNGGKKKLEKHFPDKYTLLTKVRHVSVCNACPVSPSSLRENNTRGTLGARGKGNGPFSKILNTKGTSRKQRDRKA